MIWTYIRRLVKLLIKNDLPHLSNRTEEEEAGLGIPVKPCQNRALSSLHRSRDFKIKWTWVNCISAFSSYSSWYLLWQNLSWHRNIVGKALHKYILQDRHCPKDITKEWTRQIKDDMTKRTQGDVCLTEPTIQPLLQRCSNEPCVLAESQIIHSFTPWAGISGNLSFVYLACSVCFLHSFSLHETIFFGQLFPWISYIQGITYIMSKMLFSVGQNVMAI